MQEEKYILVLIKTRYVHAEPRIEGNRCVYFICKYFPRLKILIKQNYLVPESPEVDKPKLAYFLNIDSIIENQRAFLSSKSVYVKSETEIDVNLDKEFTLRLFDHNEWPAELDRPVKLKCKEIYLKSLDGVVTPSEGTQTIRVSKGKFDDFLDIKNYSTEIVRVPVQEFDQNTAELLRNTFFATNNIVATILIYKLDIDAGPFSYVRFSSIFFNNFFLNQQRRILGQEPNYNFIRENEQAIVNLATAIHSRLQVIGEPFV